MIPETIGALLAFLGLVAPGLVFQLAREKSRSTLTETSFREASRVALASLGISGTSTALLALVRAVHPNWMPDPGSWLTDGDAYFASHYRLVLRALLLEVVLACALAAGIAWCIARSDKSPGEVSKRSVWFTVLRTNRPKGKVPWVNLHLKSGGDYWGFVGHYTSDMPQVDREISLIGPDLQYRAPGARTIKKLDANWETVVIAASEIEYMKVNYEPEA